MSSSSAGTSVYKLVDSGTGGAGGFTPVKLSMVNAVASSDYGYWNGYELTPEKALDGDVDTMFHTGDDSVGQWWRADFEGGP